MELAGKKALVTGASRGVGRAIAESFLAVGMEVFGASRVPDKVEWPAGLTPVKMDASSSESVEIAWIESGLGDQGFDIVVNNAGAGVFGGFAERDFADWERQIGLLLLGSMKLSHLALKHWTKQKPGILVNVGSLAVEYPIPYMSGYNAAKAGLAAFCESLLLEIDSDAARVIELRLGDVDTNFNDGIVGVPLGDRQAKVWEAMCKHVSEGPAPREVADKLLEVLAGERSGLVRSGSFFQTALASLVGRLVSPRLKCQLNLSYYNVSKD